MDKNSDYLQKLNSAAAAAARWALLWRLRWLWVLATAFLIFLLCLRGAAAKEMEAGEILAGLAIIASLMVWLRIRYVILLFALISLIGSLAIFSLTSYQSHTALYWLGTAGASLTLLSCSYSLLVAGTDFVSANSDKMQEQRIQVQHWLNALVTGQNCDQVIEFVEQSFRTGTRVHRLLRAESFWAHATFKPHVKHSTLLTYKVCPLNEIRLSHAGEGKLLLQIGSYGVYTAAPVRAH